MGSSNFPLTMFPTPKLSSWCWTSVPRERSSLSPALYSQCGFLLSGFGHRGEKQLIKHLIVKTCGIWDFKAVVASAAGAGEVGGHLKSTTLSRVGPWSLHTLWDEPLKSTHSGVGTWHPPHCLGCAPCVALQWVIQEPISISRLWVFSKFPQSSLVSRSDLFFLFEGTSVGHIGVCVEWEAENTPLHP